MTKSQTRILAVLGLFLCSLVLGAPIASASQAATETVAPVPGNEASLLKADLLSSIFATAHSEAFYDPTHTPNCTWTCSSGATGSATATSDSDCGRRCRLACGNLCVF